MTVSFQLSASRPEHVLSLACLSLSGPPELQEEATDIQKLLGEVGVGYTHRNDELIKDNAIEEMRMEALLEVCCLPQMLQPPPPCLSAHIWYR